MRRGLGIAFLCAIALAVTACGSSGSSSSASGGSSGSSGSSSGSSASVSGAKVLAASAMNNPPKGTITYCTGKDTTGAAAYVVAQFNAKYGAQGYHGQVGAVPGLGRPAAGAVHPAPAGEVELTATCSRPT